MNNVPCLQQAEAWFAANRWEVFPFQRQAWQAWHRGESGLIHSPTGSGKTLAAWLGPVQAALAGQDAHEDTGIQVLWITPLRALAGDTREKLEQAANALGLDIRVEVRTGDTPASRRNKQRSEPPFALITTPESLSVMLSYPWVDIALGDVHTVIVDEWHELLASKRGVQLELCLARLRHLCEPLRIWGLSATLANLHQAMATLLGPAMPGQLIQGVVPREVVVQSLRPASGQRFPWSGHLGLTLVEPVAGAIEQAATTLLFTNTRSQAELWFQALLGVRPDWVEHIALHHGSIDRALRLEIEARLREGAVRCVVCTSSLDLGVDFSPVDQVLQVGSPKGVARLMQRAGRSGHRPGAESRVLCVPTHAFELVEIAAVREALAQRRIEAREPLTRSLDVLSQHLVTIALGAGFEGPRMLAEVRSTHAFAELSDAEWGWVLDFVTRGGQALQGYPQYHKVLPVAGRYRVMNEQVQQRHRMSIGTISSDTQITVRYRNGKTLGHVEEGFISKVEPGGSFMFAGRQLELIRVKDMTAQVRTAKRKSRYVPRWQGTRMPLSTELADSVLETLQAWLQEQHHSDELDVVAPLLRLQLAWSILPGPDDFLIETTDTREGRSLFCYPFAGRLVNEGLAMLIAHRLSHVQPITFSLLANDYGFELNSPSSFQVSEEQLRRAFSTENLLDDILASVNASEIAKRQFRDIARIAGLVFEGYPGRTKATRQVQASSSLIYQVLCDYDADNLLLGQARREVLEAQLEYRRMAAALETLQTRHWHLQHTERLTPLSFPLWAESLQTQVVSSENWNQRIERMLGQLEAAAAETLG